MRQASRFTVALRCDINRRPDSAPLVTDGNCCWRPDHSIIASDPYHVSKWKKDSTIVFNVQVLNAACFESITGHALPPTPINAKTYTELGCPFFEMYEEPSSIAENFGEVKSITDLDEVEETHYHTTLQLPRSLGLASQ